MEPIYSISLAPEFETLISDNYVVWSALAEGINRVPLSSHWEPAELRFSSRGQALPRQADIATVYFPGVLALSEKSSRLIFGEPRTNLELLPVAVEGKTWYVVNCLQSISIDKDSEESVIFRGENDEIFLASWIVGKKAAAEDEIFVLDGSNRKFIYCTDEFREKIDSNRLCGITFAPIGVLI